MKKWIGCSGYFYWGWKGKFYPEDLKPSQWFKYYSNFFNTVEINSTFYRFPKKSSMRKWYREAPENFKFTVKVNKEITHLHRLKGVKDRLNEFYKIVSEALQEKLGTFLFQLPPSYKFSEENLTRIMETLDPEFRNVVEFRHESWWDTRVYELLEKNNIIFCSVSAPSLTDNLIKTSEVGYIRFHGVKGWYNYDYNEEELSLWAEKIKKVNFEEVYVYFNNDYNAYAPYNAQKLKEFL